MSIIVNVGILAALLANDEDADDAADYEERLAAVNRLLLAAGLPPHVEPRELPPLKWRPTFSEFDFRTMEFLCRAYAHCRAAPGWMATPVAEGSPVVTDPVLQHERRTGASHLVIQADHDGFYLPIDFHDVLYADPDDSFGLNGMLGSSYRLLEELIFVAPALGITLQDGHLSDAEAARLDDLAWQPSGLFRELTVWLVLYEAARLSVEHGTAIEFG